MMRLWGNAGRCLRRLRRVVTGALEEARRTGDIGSSLEAAPDIYVTDPTYTEALGQEDLAALCITSQASLFEQEGSVRGVFVWRMRRALP